MPRRAPANRTHPCASFPSSPTLCHASRAGGGVVKVKIGGTGGGREHFAVALYHPVKRSGGEGKDMVPETPPKCRIVLYRDSSLLCLRSTHRNSGHSCVDQESLCRRGHQRRGAR